MKTYIVKDRQSIFDVVLQELGSIELLFDLIASNSNELNVNSLVKAGQILNITDAEINSSGVIQSYFKSNNITIVTDEEQNISKGDFLPGDFDGNDFKTL